jgi:aspartate-semialdehyde dehydrogenase
LDKNLPVRLRGWLGPLDVATVEFLGWKGMRNGALVRAARAQGFAVLVTADRALALAPRDWRPLACVLVTSNNVVRLQAAAAEITAACTAAVPGQRVVVKVWRRTAACSCTPLRPPLVVRANGEPADTRGGPLCAALPTGEEHSMGYKVAVVGATGAVGNELLQILAERDFPVDEVVALASERSVGRQVSFGEDRALDVQDLESFDFEGCDLGLFSPGAKVSAIHAPRAAAAGCTVIDNTSHFRMFPDVPLVVPEVNREALQGFRQRNIVANPNCSTIQMVVALKPLHEIARIRRVVVATYQSASGAGKEGMDELFEHTKAIYMNDRKDPEVFQRTIAFNCIPQIDSFLGDGSTKEEWKMQVETKKILDPAIEVAATCVRVPVFVGHAEAVAVEFETPIEVEEAREALAEAEGVVLIDDPERGEYVTQVDCVGEFGVFVSRLRKDPSVPHGLLMWIVSDNLRKGAALNAVQIAEAMVEDGLI